MIGNTRKIEGLQKKEISFKKEDAIAKMIRDSIFGTSPVEDLPITPYMKRILVARFRTAG